MATIDGEQWIAKRLAFLKDRLAEDLAPEERQAAEAEVEALARERGIAPGGRRVSRIGRRIRGLLRR